MTDYIAFAGDLHDEPERINHVLHTIETNSVRNLWLCGDISSVGTLEQFEGHKVNLVFGNADDIPGLCRQAEQQRVVVYGDSGRNTYETPDGELVTFIVRHGLDPREMAYAMAAHNVDYVVHGHYHSQEQTEVGSGAVLSYGLGVLLYDLSTDTFEHIEL